MDRRTEELPAEPDGREPTLPLPRQQDFSGRGEAPRRVRGKRTVAALLAIGLAVSAFLAGWALGRGGQGPAPQRVPVESLPLPTRSAVYCGRALDVAARVVQIYRSALENRTAAVETASGRDLDVLRRLDGQLQAMTDAAGRLERRVTRALATCPS